MQERERLGSALRTAARGLVERDTMMEVLGLAAVAREHVLVIGPPGTAKSEAVRRFARVVGGSWFEYLLGRFTEPSELFGPIDLRRLRDGIVETQTAGMLPEAEIAFLDEVFLGSTAILNTLLGVLNERVFRRGHAATPVPLRLCVGASNALPDDESLAAFADRFLLRVFVEPVRDPQLEDLLEAGWRSEAPPSAAEASIADLDAMSALARAVDLGAVRPSLAQVLRTLRAAGIVVTDRRAVKMQKLVAAAAALHGRSVANDADLWPVVFALPTAVAQRDGREALKGLLGTSDNLLLPAAAATASLGPLARARLLVEEGVAMLDSPDVGGPAAWRLKLEGLAREIDAGFDASSMPEELKAMRARLVETIGRAA